MKRFISIISALGAGTIIITSSAIFLNGCTARNEQSSPQAQTAQGTPTLEEQLQIEKNSLKELERISDNVKEDLQRGIKEREKSKALLEEVSRQKDPALIQRATLDLQEWDKIVARATETSKRIEASMAETFTKILNLAKQIKDGGAQ